MNKHLNIISIALIIFSIICSIYIQNYAFNKRAILIDQVQHFYDMKKWLESGKLPTTGARFIASQVINEEFTTPRVHGGTIYFILYFIKWQKKVY